MSTRKHDGAQLRTDGIDPRPWTPVSDGNGDTAADVNDADPDADVLVRPDRTVWVAQKTRYHRAYHLFPDCHLHGDNSGPEAAADTAGGLTLCDHCEMREKVRIAVSDDEIPPNPTVEAAIATDPDATPTRGDDEATDPREQIPDDATPDDAGDWLGGANSQRTNPRDAN